MTKNKSFLTFLAILLVVLTSACATARSGGAGRAWARISSVATPPILTVVLTNNTNLPIEVYENGSPVMFKDSSGNWQKGVIPSGGTVPREYYNFLGRRDIVITVQGICPPTPPTATRRSAGCVPGQYAGTASRRFMIYTDGQFHADHWEIDYLRGPRGVY